MNKPSIFRLRDSVYGLFGLAALAIAIWIQVGAEPGTPAVAFVITWLMAALFILMWPARIWARADFNRRIDFVTIHKICVFKNGYNITAEDCERVIDSLLSKWPNTSEDGCEHSYAKAYNALSKDYSFVSFEQGPHLDHQRMGSGDRWFAGLTSGRTSRVAFKEADISVEKTAFAHEMGHIAFGVLHGNNWRLNEEFHKFSKKYRLGV